MGPMGSVFVFAWLAIHFSNIICNQLCFSECMSVVVLFSLGVPTNCVFCFYHLRILHICVGLSVLCAQLGINK